ncbi:MAG: hypothetical protein ABSH03_03845 [Candidatus Lustribacter sp.]|jgi:hypothetical protein
MSETIAPDPSLPENNDLSGRRNFLSRSGLMIALLALAGGQGVADAAVVSSIDAPNLNSVLHEAISAGSLNTKSPAFLKLSPDLQKALSTLSPSDLAVLRNAEQILGSRISATADNNGTIGM